MATKQRGGEPLQLDGGPLGELCFEWHQDRYEHWWNVPNCEGQIRSHAFQREDVWPINAPLQQIHRQSFPDGREVVFGIGMAGRGHWSASFTLIPDLKCWIVELACRAPQTPERLVSTYDLPGHWESTATNTFSPVDSSAALTIEGLSPSSAASLQADQLSIIPKQIHPGPSTTQWSFRLKVSPK